MCEWCPANGVGCNMCAIEAQRWADDGGRVVDYVDHDAPTVAADTVPEMAALTSTEERSDERIDWIAFWLILVGSTLWVGAFVFALVFYSRR